MELKLKMDNTGYSVIIERGAINRLNEYFNLNRKVFIVTDSGVPSEYAKTVANQCKTAFIYTIPQGEQSKSLDMFKNICTNMLEQELSRNDCVCAVGGGVVGDLSGFAAACYMRGIDFYNVPTTLLSQLDSSVGGKTAIDFNGIKNILGAFHQPENVVIDPDTLKTLDNRQFTNGLAEAIKMGLITDEKLFSIIEAKDIAENIDVIIERTVKNKIIIVENDEKETGLRRILNFGHTIGHGIESVTDFYHGESVALGMLPMCTGNAKGRLIKVLEKVGLPTSCDFDVEKAYEALRHDKKSTQNGVNIICVEKVGESLQKKATFEELKTLMQEEFSK